MGINVGVSVPKGDAIGAGVSVGALCAGVEVCEGTVVSRGMGVNVSVKGMPVDVSATIGEGEASGSPLLRLQARVVTINKRREYRFLFFISSLY